MFGLRESSDSINCVEFKYGQPNRFNYNGLVIFPISSTSFGKLFCTSLGALDCELQLVV